MSLYSKLALADQTRAAARERAFGAGQEEEPKGLLHNLFLFVVLMYILKTKGII